MQQFNSSGPGWPGGTFTEWERSQPIAQMNVKSNVIAPIAAAITTGVLAGLVALIATLYFGWALWVPVVVWVLVTAGAWFAYFSLSTGLLRTTERVIADAMAEPSPPQELRQELRIEVTERATHGGGTMRFIELDGISEDVLRGWARDVAVRGESLTVPRWCGAGRAFTQSDYTVLMSQMESRGFVVNHGGSRGRRLTAAGRALLKKLAE